jgi:beta-phosphoglucomutase-like phosphatase (HAD superfamily)
LLIDLDGTLIDSDEAHLCAFNQVLDAYGVRLTRDAFHAVVAGNNTPAIFQALLPGIGIEEVGALGARKEDLIPSLLDRIEASSGALALLRGATEAGCRIAVVTNATRQNATAILDHLGMSRYIAVVVAAEDSPAPKPSPAPYQVALELLRLLPQHVVAIEDSVSGVTSARGAGLIVLGITGNKAPLPLLAAGARACFATLAEVGAELGLL